MDRAGKGEWPFSSLLFPSILKTEREDKVGFHHCSPPLLFFPDGEENCDCTLPPLPVCSLDLSCGKKWWRSTAAKAYFVLWLWLFKQARQKEPGSRRKSRPCTKFSSPDCLEKEKKTRDGNCFKTAAVSWLAAERWGCADAHMGIKKERRQTKSFRSEFDLGWIHL